MRNVVKDDKAHVWAWELRGGGEWLISTGAGIFGVEMFLLENGEILLNEIAPRPHNSGHYTIEVLS